ncbi:hypothetical protein [Asanoa sp. NPDC050611]|uniref:hypothetical protein n=1 Tax=Asanoa sp. NPDC050611 TaxID=3157098 RepID=UPI0033D11265
MGIDDLTTTIVPTSVGLTLAYATGLALLIRAALRGSGALPTVRFVQDEPGQPPVPSRS